MRKLSNVYLSKIKALFPIHGKSERNYIKKYKTDVEEFLANKPDVALEDLYGEFGNPAEVVKSYYDFADTDDIIKRIKISKYIKAVAIVLIICLLSYTAFRAYLIYDEHRIFSEEQVFFEETVIE